MARWVLFLGVLSMLVGFWGLFSLPPDAKLPDFYGFAIIGGVLVTFIGIPLVAGKQQEEEKQAYWEERERKEEMERKKWKVCPHCAETIKIEAKVCRYCGRNLG